MLLYVPAMHAEHASLLPSEPATQRHSPKPDAPADESEREGQFWHVDSLVAAVAFEYLPEAHTIQSEAADSPEYFPVSHFEQLPSPFQSL